MSVAASMFGGWKATSPYARVPLLYQGRDRTERDAADAG